ncbi:MAG: chorismate synthase [Clostridia bacterium]|nr:chorismate synthase [Clostridia bacterium]
MKNTFGNNISLTLFGESHGEAIGAVIDGLCAGIEIDEGFIKEQLSKRRPSGNTDTPRVEMDEFKIVSGVFNKKTTGTPIAIIIPNTNTNSKAYNYGIARPSHADYTAFVKYGGNEDYRGGGHFSGRITAALVCAGAILLQALKGVGVKIGTHILCCGEEKDTSFSVNSRDVEKEIDKLNARENEAIPLLSDCSDKIREVIRKASENKDSVGGVLQTAIVGMPAGVGEPWFDSVESMLSHVLFSIGGVKGVEFGSGFEMAKMLGSQANDVFRYDENGNAYTETNNNGGINGGITNGMPIIFNSAIKPTPSIAQKQETIDFLNKKNTTLEVKGRHDPAIIRRACVVVDSACALVMCDLLASTYGTSVFKRGIK